MTSMNLFIRYYIFYDPWYASLDSISMLQWALYTDHFCHVLFYFIFSSVQLTGIAGEVSVTGGMSLLKVKFFWIILFTPC